MAQDVRDSVTQATAPARWLLDLGLEGVPLTATHVLARAVVREAALRWPGWWNAELFGPPHREADLRVLAALREGLLRSKLMRRRGQKLYATPLGRELATRPALLINKLSPDLGTGAGQGRWPGYAEPRIPLDRRRGSVLHHRRRV
jgi:hypothetical protein